MKWKAIRLELDRTRDYPKGSASRAYLLRAPLTEDGSIDEATVVSMPEQATVRRMWPSQPDVSGHLVRLGQRWGFLAGRNADEKKIFSEWESRPISEGGVLTMRENGQELPFRVAKLSDLG